MRKAKLRGIRADMQTIRARLVEIKERQAKLAANPAETKRMSEVERLNASFLNIARKDPTFKLPPPLPLHPLHLQPGGLGAPPETAQDEEKAPASPTGTVESGRRAGSRGAKSREAARRRGMRAMSRSPDETRTPAEIDRIAFQAGKQNWSVQKLKDRYHSIA